MTGWPGPASLVEGYDDGVAYDVEEGLMSSFPVRLSGGGYEIAEGLEVGDFARAKIDATVSELKEERDSVRELGMI